MPPSEKPNTITTLIRAGVPAAIIVGLAIGLGSVLLLLALGLILFNLVWLGKR